MSNLECMMVSFAVGIIGGLLGWSLVFALCVVFACMFIVSIVRSLL